MYIAAGLDGVFALSEAASAQIWQRSGLNAVRSTMVQRMDTELVQTNPDSEEAVNLPQMKCPSL